MNSYDQYADTAEHVETFRQFVFGGRFSPEILLIAGIGLVALLSVLVWRETLRGKRWMILPLILLRAGAVAVVVWMLAEPAIRTVTRRRHARSIAVLVDSSASMGVVDPSEEYAGEVRWAAARDRSKASKLLVELDGAGTALETAQGSMSRFLAALESKGSGDELKRAASGARRGTETALASIERAIETGLNPHLGDVDRVREIRERLKGDILPDVAAAAEDALEGEIVLTGDRRERLEAVRAGLGTCRRDLDLLTAGFVAELSANPDSSLLELLHRQATMSRSEKVLAVLEGAKQDWMAEVQEEAGLLGYRFDSEVYPLGSGKWGEALSGEGGGMATDLGAPLVQVSLDRAGNAVEAAFVLTDGGHNAPRDVLKVASAMTGLPVYVVPVGNSRPLRDVILHHVEAPRAAFKDDLIEIKGFVDVYGCVGETVTAELIRERVVVDSVEMVVPSETFSRRLTFTDKARELGTQSYLLRVAEVPEERSGGNNESKVDVEVVTHEVRVFLADDLPRWEYRYLRNLFRRDERIEFEELLFEPRDASTGRPARGTGFPTSVNDWSRYRVVILGDLGPRDLPEEQQRMLDTYVGKRGGTLILIAGENAMPGAYRGQPLAKLVPVELAGGRAGGDSEGYSIFVTPEGRSETATKLAESPLASDRAWAEMLPVYGLSPFSIPKPTSLVLLGASPRDWRGQRREENRAFLCSQRYGKGRVVYIAAPVTYRLRFRQGDLYHHRFWGQLLRWSIAREMAGGSRTVKLSTDKGRYARGEDVQVTAWLNDTSGKPVSGVVVRVAGEHDGEEIAEISLEENEEQPGLYQAVLEDLPVGSVTLRAEGAQVARLLGEEGFDGAVEAELVIDPPDVQELRDTRCNLPLLTKIAETTGGGVLPPTALPAAVRQLDLSPEVTETATTEPLWAHWGFLAVFLGCLSVEWILRKSAGMG